MGALHYTYYVVAHFHLVLSLGAVISIIVGVLYFQEILSASTPLCISTVYIHYYINMCMGITGIFTPQHLQGSNYQPRRVEGTLDSYNSWNTLSSLVSLIPFISVY